MGAVWNAYGARLSGAESPGARRGTSMLVVLLRLRSGGGPRLEGYGLRVPVDAEGDGCGFEWRAGGGGA